MEIIVEEKEGYHIITPVGELDVYTVPLFRKVVLKQEGNRSHEMILDLTGVSFIDSSGLGSLLEVYQKIKSAQGDLVFVIDNPRIIKILKLVNLDKVFKVFSNLGSALQHVGVTGGYVDENFFSDTV